MIGHSFFVLFLFESDSWTTISINNKKIEMLEIELQRDYQRNTVSPKDPIYNRIILFPHLGPLNTRKKKTPKTTWIDSFYRCKYIQIHHWNMLSNVSQLPAFWNVVGNSTFSQNINIHASIFGINNNITNNNRMDNSLFWGGGVLVNNDNTIFWFIWSTE